MTIISFKDAKERKDKENEKLYEDDKYIQILGNKGFYQVSLKLLEDIGFGDTPLSELDEDIIKGLIRITVGGINASIELAEQKENHQSKKPSFTIIKPLNDSGDD